MCLVDCEHCSRLEWLLTPWTDGIPIHFLHLSCCGKYYEDLHSILATMYTFKPKIKKIHINYVCIIKKNSQMSTKIDCTFFLNNLLKILLKANMK